MKFHLVWLICAVVCFSGCSARQGLKDNSKDASVQAKPAKNPVTPDVVTSSNYLIILPTATVRVSAGPQTKAATATASPASKKALRLSQMNHAERKCCKLGQRASKKGYFCNLDLTYSERYQNMEHNKKMKFQIKPVSKKSQRFVRHMERWCVKTGLKRVFRKCCQTA